MAKKVKILKKRKIDWLNHVFNFVAIIIGVYLAFYMNERTKANQDREESIVLMTSLLNDLTYDIETYEEEQIPENEEDQKIIGDVLQLLLVDSLAGNEDQLGRVIELQNYQPSSSTYSSMKSSGKLSLIDDLSLQKELADYYEGAVLESIDRGARQADFLSNELLTWYMDNLDFVDMQVVNEGELIVLRNKLIIYESLIDQKLQYYERVVKDSKKLKIQIESIIESR